MAGKLEGKRIAFLTADEGVEQIELERPMREIAEEGADVRLLSPGGNRVQGFEHLDKGKTFEADGKVADADAGDFDGLVMPGGVANPDDLRTNDDAVEFVRSFFEAGKPVAAICHAPWMLVEAGVVDGRTVTSYPSLKTDIENAGGIWVDEEVHVDAGLVTSRRPDDLDAFIAKAIEEFCEGVHSEQRDQTAGAAM